MRNKTSFKGPLKTKNEIKKVHAASKLTAHILDQVNTIIKPGITTNEINTFVHEMTIRNDAIPAPLNYHGFPKSVCTSINNVICHGIPNDLPLTDGDIINVDVTCIVDGYYGDSSRMYYVGNNIDDTSKKLVSTTYDCLYKGIQQAKPGNTTGDIGYAIQEYAEKNGFSVVREYGGHGIGSQFHEDPHIHHFGSPGTGIILEPNMVFTIEPMINEGEPYCQLLDDKWTVVTKDGSLSAQWEHTIAITDDEPLILTNSPLFKIVD